jgi:hypothetical protein
MLGGRMQHVLCFACLGVVYQEDRTQDRHDRAPGGLARRTSCLRCT